MKGSNVMLPVLQCILIVFIRKLCLRTTGFAPLVNLERGTVARGEEQRESTIQPISEAKHRT